MSQPEPEPSAPPLRLFNVFAKSPETLEKCYYTVPLSIHTYFFRRIFAGRRGIYQELVSPFISALYDECKRRGLDGERAIWDPSNEQLVAGVLRDLNFRPEDVRPSVPDAARSPRKRRATPRPDVPPGQPEPSPRDG